MAPISISLKGFEVAPERLQVITPFDNHRQNK
jgi:hypothetical protein